MPTSDLLLRADQRTKDRRRADRIENVAPELIPLLRDPAGIVLPEATDMDERRARAIAASAILLCLALGFLLRFAG